MFAWLAAVAEFGDGLLILLGLFTRVAAVFTGGRTGTAPKQVALERG